MAQFATMESEEAMRALAVQSSDPTTPEGFVIMFDEMVLDRLMSEAIPKAEANKTGVHIVRKTGDVKASSYLEAATACNNLLGGKVTSMQDALDFVADHIGRLNLNRWFSVSFEGEMPETAATHFTQFTSGRVGREITVELLHDLHLTPEGVADHMRRYRQAIASPPTFAM